MYSFLMYCVLLFNGVFGIIGGFNVHIGSAPYQVNYGDICGGVLIGEIWAMTSGHCKMKTYIRVGSSRRTEGRKVIIEEQFTHPRFMERHEFDFDLKLLKLEEPVKMSSYVQPVEFGTQDMLELGSLALVTGWGYGEEEGYYSELLHGVYVNLVSKMTCQRVPVDSYNYSLTPRMFCAGGAGRKDACQGDSGGPVIMNGKLIGLSSFGYGCGRRKIPGVYTRILLPEIRNWIEEVTGI